MISKSDISLLFTTTCRKIAREMSKRNLNLKFQEPDLELLFFQFAFLKLWKLWHDDKINFSNPHLKSYLDVKARFAIKDGIREEMIGLDINMQRRLKKWKCPDCGFETTLYEHHFKSHKKNKSICLCGRKMTWTFDADENPLNFVRPFSALEKQHEEEICGISFHRPFKKIDNEDELDFICRNSDRHLLELRFIHNLSYEALGKKLHMAQSNVHKKVRQALKSCREIVLNNKCAFERSLKEAV